MTYNNSLQGRFFSSSYSLGVMLLVSLSLWIAGTLYGIGSKEGLFPSLRACFINDYLARGVSLLSYVATAIVLARLYLFERRLQRLSVIFIWLSSVMMFLHADFISALSALLFVLAIAQLISCNQPQGDERALFGAFAFLSFLSLFLLYFALLLPLFIIYLVVANMCNIRNLAASLLGCITPYWLLLGVIFVFPSLDGLLLPLQFCFVDIKTVASLSFTPLVSILFVMEIAVWAVALYSFYSSSLPAKPLLRRRFIFLFLTNAYLLLLSLILPQAYTMFLSWRLSGFAVMVSYTFALGITRISNIYFIILNMTWLAIATICLWIG